MDFTLIALSVTPLLAILVYRSSTSSRWCRMNQEEAERDRLDRQEGLHFDQGLKAFARGEYEEGRLAEKSLESVSAALRARRVKSLLPPLVSTVVSIGTALVLLYGTKLVLAGQMTAGSLVVFLVYLSRLFKPIQDLAKMASSVAQAAVGLERIKAIIDTAEKTPELPGAREAESINGEVEFCNVSFGYDPNRLTLKDVSFRNRPVRWSASSGRPAGASRPSSAHPPLLDPVSGQVSLMAGCARLTLKSLREQISCVLKTRNSFARPSGRTSHTASLKRLAKRSCAPPRSQTS